MKTSDAEALLALVEGLGQPAADLGQRRTWREHACHAGGLQRGDVGVGDDAADHDEHVGATLLREQLDHLGHEREVRTREQREAHGVGVFLDDCLDDLLRGLVQAGVDDLEALVAQGAGDDLGPSVMAIQAGLGNDDSIGALHGSDDRPASEGEAQSSQGGLVDLASVPHPSPLPSEDAAVDLAPRNGPATGFGLLSALVREARPRQWVKNVLVFIAPVAAGNLFHDGVLRPTLVAFAAFCLVASGIYFLNDARDVEVDRAHPKKRFRPIASGEIPVPLAVAVGTVLLLGGIVLGFLGATWQLGVVLVVYVAVNVLYTTWLKTEPVIELACVAAGFVLRSLGGGAASHTALSVWFVVVISFGALFIVVGKRLAELPEVAGASGERRAVLAKYTKSYLESALTLCAGVAVAAYCLWAFEGQGLAGRAVGREVWIHLTVVPVVLAVLHLMRRLDAGDGGAPEDLAFKDHLLQACGVLWVLFVVIGVYG